MALKPLPCEVDLLYVHRVLRQVRQVVARDLNTASRAAFDDFSAPVSLRL